MELKQEFANYSISHATLVEHDMVQRAVDFLNYAGHGLESNPEFARRLAEINQEWQGIIDRGRQTVYGFEFGNVDDRESTYYLWTETIYDFMNEIAPQGCYFGASEGDGSDIGFWRFECDCYHMVDSGAFGLLRQYYAVNTYETTDGLEICMDCGGYRD